MRRMFISVDNEGLAGVTSWRWEGYPQTPEFARMRRIMTDETLAVIAGAEAAGIGEFVIADSHGSAINLEIERFADNCTIARSWPRPLSMADGIDSGRFEAAALIGWHCAAGAPHGTLRHTMTDDYAKVRLNGKIASETTIHAAICGHFGVPVMLCSGDDAYCDHARALLGDVETVTSKWTRGFASVRTRTPAAVQADLRAAAERAVRRVGEVAPFRINGPIRLEIDFVAPLAAEIAAMLPGIERSGSTVIAVKAADILEVSRYLTFFGHYGSRPSV